MYIKGSDTSNERGARVTGLNAAHLTPCGSWGVALELVLLAALLTWLIYACRLSG